MGQIEPRRGRHRACRRRGAALGRPDPRRSCTIGGRPLACGRRRRRRRLPRRQSPSSSRRRRGLEDRAADCLARARRAVRGGDGRGHAAGIRPRARSARCPTTSTSWPSTTRRGRSRRPICSPPSSPRWPAARPARSPPSPSADTVKRIHEGVVVSTLDREELALAQTPQAFRLDLLRQVHVDASTSGVQVTDDATPDRAGGPHGARASRRPPELQDHHADGPRDSRGADGRAA